MSSKGDIVDETTTKETDCLQLPKSSIQDIHKYDIGLFFDKIHLMSDDGKFDHVTNVWKPPADYNFPERGNVPMNSLIFFQTYVTQNILMVCFVCLVLYLMVCFVLSCVVFDGLFCLSCVVFDGLFCLSCVVFDGLFLFVLCYI